MESMKDTLKNPLKSFPIAAKNFVVNSWQTKARDLLYPQEVVP
ncbi:MAG: hypothetical protein JWR87_3064 [Segetibacter sp.]|jgi:hypothetical protein|nr:hypothetical protein [Segetibacter sp.]